MKIVVDRSEIQDKVQNAYQAAKGSAGLLMFDINADGSFIYATNLQQSLKEPLQAEIHGYGKACVLLDKLFEIIKEMNGDPITISLSEDKKWVTIVAGKNKVKMATSKEDFPNWPEMAAEEKVVFNPDALVEMIDKTVYASGSSNERYALRSVLFHIEPDVVNVVGTDGYRLAVLTKEVSHGIKEKKLIIARESAKALKRVILHNNPESVTMTIGTNHVLFKIAGSDFVATQVQGSYPDYKHVLPADKGDLLLNRDEFLKILKRVSAMPDNRDCMLKLTVSNGLMVVSSENPVFGTMTDEINIDYKGDPLTVGFNARFLIEALSAIEGNTVSFSLYGSTGASLLVKPGQDSYRCVVMPMRL